MTIDHVQADDAVGIVAVLQRDGAVIVEGFLSDDLLARFAAEIESSWRPPHTAVRRGACCGLRTRGLHGGGADPTADVLRRGMHVSSCLGWLHTEGNQYIATPLETVRTLPRESQALLGDARHDALAIGGGYLGAVELQDPGRAPRRRRPLSGPRAARPRRCGV
jgi:hypothetical protein